MEPVERSLVENTYIEATEKTKREIPANIHLLSYLGCSLQSQLKYAQSKTEKDGRGVVVILWPNLIGIEYEDQIVG